MKIHCMNFADPLIGGYMREDSLYAYIEQYANKHKLSQTEKALPFAKEKHKGQTRKGDIIPYIYHPLMVAYHAITIGLDEDTLIAAAILHDVCEDCAVPVVDLPVDETVKEVVCLLTKTEDRSPKQYYEAISKNRIALLVKILDRINNVSDMAKEFSNQKMQRYITGTEKYIYPLFAIAKEKYPEYDKQIFLMEYHIVSVVSSIKYLIDSQ